MTVITINTEKKMTCDFFFVKALKPPNLPQSRNIFFIQYLIPSYSLVEDFGRAYVELWCNI